MVQCDLSSSAMVYLVISEAANFASIAVLLCLHYVTRSGWTYLRFADCECTCTGVYTTDVITVYWPYLLIYFLKSANHLGFARKSHHLQLLGQNLYKKSKRCKTQFFNSALITTSRKDRTVFV